MGQIICILYNLRKPIIMEPVVGPASPPQSWSWLQRIQRGMLLQEIRWNHRYTDILFLPPIPKDMWKPPGWPPPKPNPKKTYFIEDSLRNINWWNGVETKTWEWVICSWLCPLALRSWRHLLPVNIISQQDSYWSCIICLKIPGIFAISVAPAIQGNHFVFAYAGLQ